jgi:hypothetical protein
VPISHAEVAAFVAENIKPLFHDKRLESLKAVKLTKILKRKNPYLFKAKHILTAEQFVKELLDAHLSSQEETIFGGFLEELAIFVCNKSFSGQKSSTEGIDLDFQKDGVRYLVSIKSGPNWGNSSQIAKMKDYFRKAKKILGANTSVQNIVAVNGCCYGRGKPEKEEYLKLCGQRFWEFISGDPNLYVKIIEPLGEKSRIRNEEFKEQYGVIIRAFSKEFLDKYCDDTGCIFWEEVIKINSGK